MLTAGLGDGQWAHTPSPHLVTLIYPDLLDRDTDRAPKVVFLQ